MTALHQETPMAMPEIDLTNNWLRIARTAAQQAMERGMDYVDAAYYVTAAANSPIRLPVLRDGSLDTDACNFMFHRLVDEFRPAGVERPS